MTTSFEDATLLLGLGAARTGTRWMSGYFSSHPQILMSPIRVLHYFDARIEPARYGKHNAAFEERLRKMQSMGRRNRPLEDRVRMISDDAAYLDYFRNQWAGEEVFCDVTPSYSNLDEQAFRCMHSTHSRVRFLFVMRNPIDRLWSSICMDHDRTNRPPDERYRELDARVSHEGQWRDYVETCTRLDAAVPAEAVKYLFFEHLFDRRTIDELCDFIGVERVDADIMNPLNQSSKSGLDATLRERAYRRFEPVYRFVHDRYGGDLPKSWLDDIERYST
jgi:hypothetical protein